MKPMTHSTLPFLGAFALVLTASPAAAQANAVEAAVEASAGQAVGQIKITNISNQILAPIAVATHRMGDMPIFVPGLAASNELTTLAETGSPAALEAMLNTEHGILYATHLPGMATVIRPGETVTGEIVFDLAHMAVSIAGMLVSTNDGFVGYTGAEIPLRGTRHYMAHAWDAGSEANTEACTDVPGPPCAEDTGNARVTDGAEGIVLIHPGIHGTAGVTHKYDWRGPVVMITVSGIGHGHGAHSE